MKVGDGLPAVTQTLIGRAPAIISVRIFWIERDRLCAIGDRRGVVGQLVVRLTAREVGRLGARFERDRMRARVNRGAVVSNKGIELAKIEIGVWAVWAKRYGLRAIRNRRVVVSPYFHRRCTD